MACLRLVGHIALTYILHKVGIVLIRDAERTHIDAPIVMATHIFICPVIHISHGIERNGKAADILRLDLHIGNNATAIVDLTTTERRKLRDKRVGHLRTGAIPTHSCIVSRLYTATRGYIIFRCRELKIGVIAEVVGALHKALAVCTRAHNNGTIHILKGTCKNLRGRGRSAIDEYDDRQMLGNRGMTRVVVYERRRVATHNRDHPTATWHKQRGYIDSLLHHTATIRAVVEDDATERIRSHKRLDSTAHLAIAILNKVVMRHISNTIT